jgi:hypothetical protein
MISLTRIFSNGVPVIPVSPIPDIGGTDQVMSIEDIGSSSHE